MTKKNTTVSVSSNGAKRRPTHPLEQFLASNDLKLVWLAKSVGTSPEMLRYFFRHNKLPAELEKKAKAAIRAKGKVLVSFGK